MPATKAGLCAVAAIALCGVVVFTQVVVRQRAPTDKAADFTLTDLQAELREMQANKLTTVRLLEGGDTFSLNLLHRVGADTPQMHGDLVDLYVVREGSATLVTGGTLVDAKKSPGREGDQSGSSIRGGVTRVIKTGDVVFIPPGVPHCFTDGDITYLNIHSLGR